MERLNENDKILSLIKIHSVSVDNLQWEKSCKGCTWDRTENTYTNEDFPCTDKLYFGAEKKDFRVLAPTISQGGPKELYRGMKLDFFQAEEILIEKGLIAKENVKYNNFRNQPKISLYDEHYAVFNDIYSLDKAIPGQTRGGVSLTYNLVSADHYGGSNKIVFVVSGQALSDLLAFTEKTRDFSSVNKFMFESEINFLTDIPSKYLLGYYFIDKQSVRFFRQNNGVNLIEKYYSQEVQQQTFIPPTMQKCPLCEGTGFKPWDPDEKCERCVGGYLEF
jgi:hypothetical protein